MTVANGSGTTIPDARIRLTNLAAQLPPWAANEIIDIIKRLHVPQEGHRKDAHQIEEGDPQGRRQHKDSEDQEPALKRAGARRHARRQLGAGERGDDRQESVTSNITPNDPYLRLMFCLPRHLREGVVSCSPTADLGAIRVTVIKGKGKDIKFFNEPYEGFPTKALLGKILLYLQ